VLCAVLLLVTEHH